MNATTTPVGLSFDAVDASVIAEVTHKIARLPRLSHAQAEEAVMEGLLALYERADEYEDRDRDSLKGLLYTFARFKALTIRDKALRHRAESLDAMTETAEETGSGRRVLGEALTDESFDLDEHVELIDLARDPILARKLEAVERGGTYGIMGRGQKHPNARYTDEQVQRVRELRADGAPREEVARMTGVPPKAQSVLCSRRNRVCGSTEGWSPELAIFAVRRWTEKHGRAPLSREAGDPTLPARGTVERMPEFGSWNGLIAAAGMAPGRKARPAWDSPGIARAFFAFRREHGRWPTSREINRDAALPTKETIGRHWHTKVTAEIIERAIDEFARLGVGL